MHAGDEQCLYNSCEIVIFQTWCTQRLDICLCVKCQITHRTSIDCLKPYSNMEPPMGTAVSHRVRLYALTTTSDKQFYHFAVCE